MTTVNQEVQDVEIVGCVGTWGKQPKAALSRYEGKDETVSAWLLTAALEEEKKTPGKVLYLHQKGDKLEDFAKSCGLEGVTCAEQGVSGSTAMVLASIPLLMATTHKELKTLFLDLGILHLDLPQLIRIISDLHNRGVSLYFGYHIDPKSETLPTVQFLNLRAVLPSKGKLYGETENGERADFASPQYYLRAEQMDEAANTLFEAESQLTVCRTLGKDSLLVYPLWDNLLERVKKGTSSHVIVIGSTPWLDAFEHAVTNELPPKPLWGRPAAVVSRFTSLREFLGGDDKLVVSKNIAWQRLYVVVATEMQEGYLEYARLASVLSTLAYAFGRGVVVSVASHNPEYFDTSTMPLVNASTTAIVEKFYE